jgi:hypothetical protein
MTSAERTGITSPATGLLVYQTDGTEGLYEKTASAWRIINGGGGGGGMAIGGAITSATAGSVLFAGASGVLAQDNANFFWDDANNRLGIGTATPSATFHSVGSVTALSSIARGNYMQPTLVAAANGDTTVGLDVTPTFTNGAFTGVTNIGLRFTATSGNPYAIYATGGNSRSYFSGTLAVGIDAQVGSSIMRVGGQLAARVFTDDEGYGTRLERNTLSLYSGSAVLAAAFSGGGLAIYSGTADATVGAGVLLSLNSTTKGFRPPRVTTTQKNAISAVSGIVVYDTTLNKLCVYSGTAWETITSI